MIIPAYFKNLELTGLYLRLTLAQIKPDLLKVHSLSII